MCPLCWWLGPGPDSQPTQNQSESAHFSEKVQSAEKQHQFHNRKQPTQTIHCTYLGLRISNTGNFSLPVNELKDKAKRAFYTINKSINTQLPIRAWLKIFKSIIEPIALYASEVWGPQTQQDSTKWDKHPIDILHAEFCKNILQVQRRAPNSELGQYPLLLNIQKQALNFWIHIKTSDLLSFSYKALCYQESNPQRNSLCLQALRLSEPPTT